MKRFLLNSTVAAIALLTASSAFAGDYNSGVVSKTPSEGYTDVEFGSGWYLRGDISYNINGADNNTSSSNSLTGTGSSFDFDDAIGVRVGFGQKLSPNTRIEVSSSSIFDSDFSSFGSARFAGTDVGGAAINNIDGTRDVSGSYQLFDFMLSGYYDFNPVSNITPYVGAGIGVARIDYNQNLTLECNPTAAQACGTGALGAASTVTTVIDDQSWTHAYQLTVGAAVAVDDRTSLDLSYSYTQIGDGDELNYADGAGLDNDGVQLHQVRAGIRYDIW